MSRLAETKKLMGTQRHIDNRIFFFEFPVGQTKISMRPKIEDVIKHVDDITFNMTTGVVTYCDINYSLGEVSCNMLYTIAQKRGERIREPDIFDQVWGHSRKYKQGHVSNTIRRIKDKMGDIILLDYAKGYYLNLNHGRPVKE
jgi:DNA-binding response OmpR family regulator